MVNTINNFNYFLPFHLSLFGIIKLNYDVMKILEEFETLKITIFE
jgi:hypothetical protein